MVKLFITGDVVPNFDPMGVETIVDRQLRSILEESDLSISNLECPITNRNEQAKKFGPALKVSSGQVSILPALGIDLVTLANNHIMDYGANGLMDTIASLVENKVAFVGAGGDEKEARKPFIYEKDGFKVGIINIAENEFIQSKEGFPGANGLNLFKNHEDIVELKGVVDKVVVIYHGGNENYNLPSPRLQDTFRFFVNAGADAVIGHHTHCVSGWETFKGAPIIYSIGNFIFDYNQRSNEEWCTGCGVELEVGKEVTFKLIPIKQFYKEEKVRLLEDKEEEEFHAKIIRLNQIINNRTALEDKFNEFVKSLSQQYFHFLQPTKNRIMHALMKRKLLPSNAFGKRQLLHLNLVRCEAHREVLLKILENGSSDT